VQGEFLPHSSEMSGVAPTIYIDQLIISSASNQCTPPPQPFDTGSQLGPLTLRAHTTHRWTTAMPSLI
jgi:hypothetical protein